jgi:hypothetical protein
VESLVVAGTTTFRMVPTVSLPAVRSGTLTRLPSLQPAAPSVRPMPPDPDLRLAVITVDGERLRPSVAATRHGERARVTYLSGRPGTSPVRKQLEGRDLRVDEPGPADAATRQRPAQEHPPGADPAGRRPQLNRSAATANAPAGDSRVTPCRGGRLSRDRVHGRA